MKTTKEEKIELLKEIKRINKEMVNNEIIVTITSVSSSGMSRTANFYYLSKNGYIYNMNYKISKILGYQMTNKGLRIRGCGLDVIFNTLYNLNCYALEYGVIKKSKNKNEKDLRYNGIVNTSYALIN